MKKSILIYGILMGLLFAVLQIVEYKYSIRDIPTSAMMGVLAIIFISIGVWVGKSLGAKKNGVDLEQQAENIEQRLLLLKISAREYEVLQLINKGLSNQQIADHLFISLSTVKSHTSNLFEKLESKRRTQALQKAKKLEILR